jgi:DNA polymerase III delta prime subunit
MFGLNDLKSKFSKYTLDTLPHSIVLIGRSGSGKHSLARYIAEQMSLSSLDVTELIDEEYIFNIYRCPTPYVYVVDLDGLSDGDKKQNILLKLFEEPSPTAFVILLSNSKTTILPTILNRGVVFNIPPYAETELAMFAEENNIEVDHKYLQTILLTPGDIKKFYSNNVNADTTKGLVDKIINKLSAASYGNTLTIADKLNYKDEYDKIDLDFFFRCLLFSLYQKYVSEFDEIPLKLYYFVDDVYTKLNKDSRLNKQITVRNMLSRMWEISKGA